ncbi:MAG: hypothetical protein AVDCRST_MAG09-213, partial [uncultured Sphingomonas sp.]
WTDRASRQATSRTRVSRRRATWDGLSRLCTTKRFVRMSRPISSTFSTSSA